MAIIGIDDETSGLNTSHGTGTNTRMNLGSSIRTAVSGEQVIKAWMRTRSTETSQTIQINLYDITGRTVTDPDNATLEHSETVTLNGAAGWYSSTLSTPFALTSGNVYAVALSDASSTIETYRFAVTSGDAATTVGDTTAPTPWVGNAYTNQFTFYMETEISGSSDFTITDITDPVLPGSSVTITGTGFGAAEGTVTQEGTVLSVVSWDPTVIVVTSLTVESTILPYGEHTFEVTLA